MSDSVRAEFRAEGWMPLDDPMSAQPGQLVRWFYRDDEDGIGWVASGGTVVHLDPKDGPASFGYINFGSLQRGEWEVYAPSNPAANGPEARIRPEFDSGGWAPLESVMDARPGDVVRSFYFDPVRDIWDAECRVVASVDPNTGVFAGGDYLIATLDDCDEWEIRRAA